MHYLLDITPPHLINNFLTRWHLAKIYKESFQIWIKKTSCGYGSVASCISSNCIGDPTQPSYIDDFIEVTVQGLLGGCY